MSARSRALISFALALAFAAASGSNARAEVTSANPVEVRVLLPASGPGAFLGAAFASTLKAVTLHVNRTGGIRGRQLKFVVADNASSPAVSLQLINSMVARHEQIIIDGGPGFVCNAALPVVSTTGPFDFCLSPVIHPAGGSYAFSASVGTDDYIAVLTRYFRLRGWTRIAVITSNDATGADFDRQLDHATGLSENGDVRIVAHEHFNPADISVAAQLARVKAANPQALIAWATGTPFGTLLHGIRDAGISLPIGAATSNQSLQQLASYADFLPAELYFPSVRAVGRGGTGKGPIRDQQITYERAFKAIGVRPDYLTSIPWDPLMIVVDALRTLGPDASAEQVRNWVLQLHGWAGISSIYDFRANDQRGIGANAANVQRWDPKLDDFVAVSRPAGYLR